MKLTVSQRSILRNSNFQSGPDWTSPLSKQVPLSQRVGHVIDERFFCQPAAIPGIVFRRDLATDYARPTSSR